jgi:hypothetical protein
VCNNRQKGNNECYNDESGERGCCTSNCNGPAKSLEVHGIAMELQGAIKIMLSIVQRARL